MEKLSFAKADQLAKGLKALGWNPSVGTVSRDGAIRTHTLGVTVKMGDPRLQWLNYTHEPVIDFFNFSNVVLGAAPALMQQPLGFEYSIVSTDTVQLVPSRRMSVEAFVERLQEYAKPPQRGLDFTSDSDAELASAPPSRRKSAASRAGL